MPLPEASLAHGNVPFYISINMSDSLKTLISKLNDTCRRAAERAAAICMSKGHYEVDVEHVFLALLEHTKCDFAMLCRRFDVTIAGISRDLDAEVGKLRTGNSRTPVFSEHLPRLLEHAWLIASLNTNAPRIRSGHLLLALLTESNLKQLALPARFFLDFLLMRLSTNLTSWRRGRARRSRRKLRRRMQSRPIEGKRTALRLWINSQPT